HGATYAATSLHFAKRPRRPSLRSGLLRNAKDVPRARQQARRSTLRESTQSPLRVALEIPASTARKRANFGMACEKKRKVSARRDSAATRRFDYSFRVRF